MSFMEWSVANQGSHLIGVYLGPSGI